MARPIEFEYDKVLNNAMEQFWKEGYEASSVQKLLDCTGINRGTLYNSFGDKETFFRSCVDTYNQTMDKSLASTLQNPELGPWEAVDKFFRSALVEISARQRSLGCLLVNSLCESINWHREMKKLVRNSLGVIRKALLVRTREAHKQGSLKKGVSPEFAADLLMSALYGLRVQSRDGMDSGLMAQQASFLIQSLEKK